ncbi:MAG: hypothetical protein ISR82_05765 [Candidatus Marinimicrobia bacterium]|nr:hypothetical protein [Candidatus Neomarinimicrobiota bacterium]
MIPIILSDDDLLNERKMHKQLAFSVRLLEILRLRLRMTGVVGSGG